MILSAASEKHKWHEFFLLLKGEFCIRIKPLGLTLLQSISTIFHIFLQVILGPDKMITVPPRHYCVVENPVLRDKDDRVVVDINGQIKLAHADQVIINNNGHSTFCFSWDFTFILVNFIIKHLPSLALLIK